MADLQQLKLQARGLYTHPNNLSEVPEGAFEVANNVVIDREGIVESRRGQKQYKERVTTSVLKGVYEYQEKLFVYNSSGQHRVDDSTYWRVLSTTMAPPSTNNGFLYTTQANKNLYLASSTGVYKNDISSATTTKLAGGPKGLDGEGTTTGSSGFMATNTNVAYRVVWGYKDNNNNLILGSPSQRIIVTNTSGGTRDVSLTFTIPDEVTTSYFYQIYRSGASATATDEPNDEMYLVYEDNPTAGEITAAVVTITDTTPDELRGATLYTSPSQEGIQNSNEQTPWAADITTYKNHVLYARTKRKATETITLIAVGGTDGLQANDTLTVGGIVYTAKASENVTNREFQIFTGGTPAENIENTAKSIVRVINRATTSTRYAFYDSGYEELPGKIRIESKNFTDLVNIATSRHTCWNPSWTGTLTGSTEDTPNRVYFSKIQQPEAVPLYRYLDVGTADKPIKRIVGLRDSVVVLKEDGIWRISGDLFENFSVTLLDGTARLKALNSIATLNNQVFCFTDQGIVAISESGVQVISRAIEDTLLQLSSVINADEFEDYTFGVGYESARKFILYTIDGVNTTGSTQAFVYNIATDSWTRWTPVGSNVWSAAYVANRDDLLYVSEVEPGSNVQQVTQERKTFTIDDYVEKEYVVDIHTVVDPETIIYKKIATLPHPSVGWAIRQGTRTSTITSVTITDTRFGTITVSPSYAGWEEDTDGLLPPGNATFYESIESEIRTVPIHGGNPGLLKQFREMTLFFSDARFNTMEAAIRNPIADIEQTITLTPTMGGTWGLFGWGNRPWGGGYGGQQPIRVLVPANVNRTNWINVGLSSNEAFTAFSLGGMSVIFTNMSSRMK